MLLSRFTSRFLEFLRPEQDPQVRLNALKDRLKKSPAGETILRYLAERQIAIAFDPSFEKSGLYGHYEPPQNGEAGQIRLNSAAKDDALINVIVHEARHAWQFEKLQALAPNPQMPPALFLGLGSLMEADAFSFNLKFSEDFAAHTGDRGPLDYEISRLNKQQTLFPQNTALSDQERFLLSMQFLKQQHGKYDSKAVACLTQVQHERSSHQIPPTIPANFTDPVIVTAARLMDKPWPFSNSSTGYLAGMSDEAILKAAGPTAQHAQEITQLQAQYSAHGRTPAPPRGRP